MAFKEPIDEQRVVFRTKKGVRVKKSYYTFSKEYPLGIFDGKKFKSKTRNKVKHRGLKIISTVVCVIVLFLTSYFAMSLALDFSYKPLELAPEDDEIILNQQVFLDESDVKALYLPSDKLADKSYLKNFVKEIEKKNANSVVIDFKTQEGKLLFSGTSKLPLPSNATIYDNETLLEALDVFVDEGIAIIARIYCFEDNLMATQNPSYAVKYMDTQVNWLDDLSENGGRAWLNPYSQDAMLYIRSVLQRTLEFGVAGVILKSVQYPDGEFVNNASYPYETSQSNKNETLTNFIKVMQAEIPENKFMILSQTSQQILSETNEELSGSLNDSIKLGFSVDLISRDENIVIDKKTDYVSMISYLNQIQSEVADKYVVPVFSAQDYSWSFFRSLKNNGLESFILFDENGEY